MKPEANVIKLPNISVSLPQIQAAVKELQPQGYASIRYLRKSKRLKASQLISAGIITPVQIW